LVDAHLYGPEKELTVNPALIEVLFQMKLFCALRKPSDSAAVSYKGNLIRVPRMTSNFSKNMREPQANHLTFRMLFDSAECKIYEIAGQTVIYSFRSITRNITRLIFSHLSH
jgi:hypothetical protein